MDKRKLHHYWTKLRRVKPWYFLVLAAVCAVICVFALRENNLHMVMLRQAVYAADKSNGNVEQALYNLRKYVYAHMNTNLDSGPDAVHLPIQLQYTYERLEKSLPNTTAANTKIYNNAQVYCQAKIPDGFSGSFRLDCIKSYVTQHGLQTATSIPKNNYEFDFASPSWSPDLAGWSLVAAILSVLLFLGSWLFQNIIRHWLHRHA